MNERFCNGKVSKENFENYLKLCIQEIVACPNLEKQYYEEIELFKELAMSNEIDLKKRPSRYIVKFLMSISSYRVRDLRKTGWVCGTYMRRVRENFEKWIQHIFEEEELRELLNCCANAVALSEQQNNMLMVMLHYMPKTVVNRYYSYL